MWDLEWKLRVILNKAPICGDVYVAYVFQNEIGCSYLFWLLSVMDYYDTIVHLITINRLVSIC